MTDGPAETVLVEHDDAARRDDDHAEPAGRPELADGPDEGGAARGVPVARGRRETRAVILTGAGRAFCAGQDLRERLEPDAAPLGVEVRERYNPIIRAMRGLDQPIVAAINGVAAGAGASLAMAADIRIAADTASVALAFGRVGLVPDSGATWFLPRLVGATRAAELALLNEPVASRGRGSARARWPSRARRSARDGGAGRSPTGSRPARRARSHSRSGRSRRPGIATSTRRSRTRRSSRTWPGARRTTPKAWPRSSRSARRGSRASRR